MAVPGDGDAPGRPAGTPAEVFFAFLKLGLTSFGGPIAHLGYFREELVSRRRWLDDARYADLVALCQFLPGPASSQVGFALGLLRAGPLGALAAWIAFTLPSALLLLVFALGASAMGGALATGILGGLKIVAVAIVAQAVWGMARTLTPDRQRATIAVIAVALVLLLPGAPGQVVAIVAGALAGLALCRGGNAAPGAAIGFPVSHAAGIIALLVFALLLLGLPVAAALVPAPVLSVVDAFYRAGALVFGGGHVVLPLLEAETVRTGWIAADEFIAGYGAAQAVPGPLFTFAAYLGASLDIGPGGAAGAAIALVAIFLPGFLILVGAIPFWDRLRSRPAAQGAIRGANAAVVGILGAALYDPLFTTSVTGPFPFALALAGFVLLTAWRCPPWIVVVLAGSAGGAAALL